jgi:hypothetical protein
VYIKANAPRSIGGVLDDAIRLYRTSFRQSWPLALFGQALVALPMLFLQLNIKNVAPRNPQAALALMLSPATWGSYLVVLLLSLAIYNAVIFMVDGVAQDKTVSFGTSLGAGFRLLPRSIWLTILIGLCFAGPGIIVAIVFAMATGQSGPLVRLVFGIGFVALGLYLLGRIFLANIVLVIEDAPALTSLKKSWMLIGGYWWRTAAIYSVAFVIALVLYVIMVVCSGVIAATMRGSFTAAMVANALVTIAFGSLLMAFFPAVLISMYYDLMLRKEGADLAGRVDALTPR